MAGPGNSPLPLRTGGQQGSAQQLSAPAKLMTPTIKKVDASKPPLDPKHARQAEWAMLNLQLEPFQEFGEKKDDRVVTNFFRITLQKDVDIRKYRIVLGKINDKEVTKRETKRELIDSIFSAKPPDAKIWVTDYFSHVISVEPLYKDCIDEENAAWRITHERHVHGNQKAAMYSTLFYEGRFNFQKMEDYVDPGTQKDDNYLPEEDFRILNLLSWRHIYAKGFQDQIVSRGKKFYLKRSQRLGNLTTKDGTNVSEVYRGFFSSMRPGHGSLYLNVNTTATAFYICQPLQTYISNRNPGSTMPTPSLKRELRGLRVTFSGDKDKSTIRVVGTFSEETSENLKFMYKGVERSVYEHMMDRTGYAIPSNQLNKNACCVCVGKANIGGVLVDVWFPADQLTIVKWQPIKAKLTGSMTADMLKCAARNPNVNRQEILSQARSPLGLLTYNDLPPFYHDFGLRIETDFTKAKTRYLRAPHIRYNDSTRTTGYDHDIFSESQYQKSDKTKRDTASWAITVISKDNNRSFYRVGMLPKKLIFINICETGDKAQEKAKANAAEVLTFGRNLAFALKSYGYNHSMPVQVIDLFLATIKNARDRRVAFQRELVAALRANKVDNTASLFIFALASKDVGVYSDIKWWGDCLNGVSTLCITPEKVRSKNGNDRGIFGNLALKLNPKLGGINHRLWSRLGLKGSTMIVGADVTHPTGTSLDDFCPSMAAVVATNDNVMMNYLGSARLQTKNTEHIEDLQGMMEERLDAYLAQSNSLPNHILFYRDGVSESQYGEVRATELNQIENACKVKYVDRQLPNITLVIVAKRHHSRFYPVEEQDHKNTRSGLVVDTEIVAPKQLNFYLQAHDSPLGTARSAHYVVLENKSNYTAEELQQITNKICFMGSRATKGLSVCTPAMYADILCERLRCYLEPVLRGALVDGLPHDVQSYRNNGVVWKTSHNNGLNPWHPKLNKTMFYL